MEKGARIEPCALGDESTVRKLLADAELPVEDLSPDNLTHFLVARTTDGEVIGAIGLEPFQEVGLLRSLVVHPSRRGRGLGHELTYEMETRARNMGIKTLFLLTVTAAGFFPELGYHIVQRAEVPAVIAETEEFQSVCPASAVCFSKNLY